MKKWVIFEFGNGSFKKGFPVTVRIGTDGIKESARITDGFLPPNPELPAKINQWWNIFVEQISKSKPRSRAIKPAKIQIKNFEQFKELTNDLHTHCNQWLNCQDEVWQQIKTELLKKLNEDDEIRVIIQTDDHDLRLFPWQVWDLFSHYQNAEFAFSPSQQKTVTIASKKSTNVKILVILGEPS